MSDEPIGPDERDMDLIDGSWEDDYYAGQREKRDWGAVQAGIVILVVLSLVLPSILIFGG